MCTSNRTYNTCIGCATTCICLFAHLARLAPGHTDSVVTDYNVIKDKALQEKYVPDMTGDALGSLKNELTDDANPRSDRRLARWLTD